MLSGPTGSVKVLALLDEGSTLTLLDAKVADAIGAEGQVGSLCITWTNGINRREEESRKITLQVASTKDGSRSYTMKNVRTIEELSLPIHRINMEKLREDWPHLHDVAFDSIQGERPMILIGQDNILLTVANKIVRGPWVAPVATKTLLGWVVHGNIPVGKSQSSSNIMIHFCDDDEYLTRLVKESFSTENFGVKVVKETLRSKQDQRAVEMMERTTRRMGNQFETGLLWRDDNLILPESKTAAIQRLNCIEKRMDRDPEFAETYAGKLEDFLEKGYAREITDEEDAVVHPRVWYVPHFSVTNPNKPGKIRLVFDAASKSRGVSLNECLLKGPDLLNSLTAVLWRFREKKIGAVGDIKEMFPQVKIISEDQQAQRFLWRGTDRKNPPRTFIMTSMIFGAACSPTSANWIKNRNAEEYQKEFPEVYNSVLKQTYMDDQLDGGDDVEQLTTHLHNVIEVYRRGGFTICNWACSSMEVLAKISPDLRAKEYVDLTAMVENPVQRVLGLIWNPSTDEFKFKLNFHKVPKDVVDGVKLPTKRQVLSLMMSIFDPLGFIAHLVIKVKILFQFIWRSGLGWDDSLTQALGERWRKWLKLLEGILRFAVPRCYYALLNVANTVDLHVFCDASEEAFDCVAYLRVEHQDEVCVAFVAAKTKVSPLKPLSIPRLELQAAVLGTRLAVTLNEELNVSIKNSHYWSDSKTVLCWIQSDSRRYKQFVSHRIGEILETSDVTEWHWVPTELNVADEGTRSGVECDFTKIVAGYGDQRF